MISVQNDLRQLQLHQQQQMVVPRVYNNGDHRNDPFLLHSEPVSGLRIGPVLDSREVDEDMLMALAHQDYKAGNFKQALENSKAVYHRNPSRTDNLLLLGAVHYQLHEFDLCIAKNEEALQIDPHFAECYGNMANAWKEKGNIDVAIRYYLIAIEVCAASSRTSDFNIVDPTVFLYSTSYMSVTVSFPGELHNHPL